MQFFKTYQVGLVCPSSMVYYVLSSSNKWRNTKGVFGWADGDGMQCSGDAAAGMQSFPCTWLFGWGLHLEEERQWQRRKGSGGGGKTSGGEKGTEEEKRER